MIFIGDVHGRFSELTQRLLDLGITGTNLVQVGDFGVGFLPPEEEKVELEELNRCLRLQGNTLYVIRGNHDDPRYFDGKRLDFSEIHLLHDYSLIELSGKPILFVGGAISVDRLARTPDSDWWSGEDFRLDRELLQSLDLSDLWAVVTHSAPNFVEPLSPSQLVAHYAETDTSLMADLKKERKDLAEMYNLVEPVGHPKYWFYGHYHFYANTVVDGTRFIALAELQFYSAGDYD